MPAARSDGLGVTYAGTIAPLTGLAGWLLLTAATAGGLLLLDEPWWRGPVCTGAATLAVALLVRRAIRRLGGVTGDIYGAAIEISLAVLLLTAT